MNEYGGGWTDGSQTRTVEELGDAIRSGERPEPEEIRAAAWATALCMYEELVELYHEYRAQDEANKIYARVCSDLGVKP